MSKVYLEDSTLTDIADAIREKTGKNGLITPANMPDEIESISGGGDFPLEVIFETFMYANYGGAYNWLFEDLADKFIMKIDSSRFDSSFEYDQTAQDLSKNIFYLINSTGISTTNALKCPKMFQNCQALIKTPKLDISTYLGNVSFQDLSNAFSNCYKITTEQVNNFLDVPGLSYLSNSNDLGLSGCFSNCNNLRTLPNIFTNGYSYSHTYNVVPSGYKDLFNGCITLDEINNFEGSFIVANPTYGRSLSSSFFVNFISECCRLKEFTFKTNNGVPYSAKWGNLSLDFSSYVGWFSTLRKNNLLNRTNIGNDKKVTDAASYEALKNDPDWWTEDVAYSRYNHDSAVRTINSLPDFSAIGNDTIKFKGAAGSATDGGAINTLTNEEIAVATNKGWTVTLV